MKTIKQALIDEIHYPIGSGIVENKIISRGLSSDRMFDADIARSNEFIGAVADCLYSLISAPSFSEADKSFTLSDKDLILKKANFLYNSIGEKSIALDEKPMVYIM